MKGNKKLWIIIGLASFMIIGRVNYFNKFEKVDERVIKGVAEYTIIIENSRRNDPVYELGEMIEIEDTLGKLIPVNEKSSKDVALILLIKDLNDILYMTHYYREKNDVEEQLVSEKEYVECLDKIKDVLTPYRGEIEEVDELWEQGIFSN